MLSPREASYAIAYALGYRAPDTTPREAAANGNLSTKGDFKREVTRLLTPGTAHPRALEFFRDFFGYPLAVKVFKDTERIGGIFENPGRGTFATPGFFMDQFFRWLHRNPRTDQYAANIPEPGNRPIVRSDTPHTRNPHNAPLSDFPFQSNLAA